MSIEFEVNIHSLSAYDLQCLEPHDNLVEFMWELEDLDILKYNKYDSIIVDDIKDILDMMIVFGFESKIKEIKVNGNLKVCVIRR